MENNNKYNNKNRWPLPGIESLSTRRDWRNSDFSCEFEKIVIESMLKLEDISEEIRKKASGLSDLANESEATKKSIEGTTDSVVKLDTALNNINSAEDEVSDDEVTEEEQKKARFELIEELRKKSYLAADSGDIILAYQIERAIEEIEEL